MIHTSSGKQRSAFSWWMRTGKVPPALNPDGLELKFNPWHDPADGRFTFANSGGRFGTAGSTSAHNAVGRTSVDVRRGVGQPGRAEPGIAPSAKADVRRAELRAKVGQRSIERGSLKARTGGMPAPRVDKRPNPAAEFIGGVGEGLYGVGKDAVVGTAAMVTTNPLTTVRHAGHAIAGMIDTAIAAEDTPAHVQIARAANAVANASARDLGRATGTVVGNVALTVAPGAALSRVATLRRLRMAAPRPTFDPPQIGWVKETINIDKPWKYYNDGATGSRPGQAPTLMRTMPDGSKRPVKFDGIEGDYVIDRKWSIRDAARARAQILRQSDALMQNHAIGVWEVPNAFQKAKALKLLGKLNVKNIKVRVVEP